MAMVTAFEFYKIKTNRKMVCLAKKCDELKLLFKILYEDYIQIRTMEKELLWAKLQRPQRTNLRINSLNLEDVRLHFRLENHDQLHTLCNGFQFPFNMKSKCGYIFSGEEVFLAGLFRLHYPNTLTN